MVRLAPDANEDPIGHLAMRHSHPVWVVQAFSDALGGDLAEVSHLLAADNDPPSVTLVVRPGRAEVSELIEAGATPGRWSPYAAVLNSGQPREIPAVAEGRAGVQDEGSQLVALALAQAETVGPDRGRWIDMCAGPGGKAALSGRPGRGTRRQPAGRRAATAPHPARAQRARRDAGCVGGNHRRRDPIAVGGGRIRPGARRRAVHRARSAPPTARGTLAAQARATSPSSLRCSAGCCTPRCAAPDQAGWSPT